MITTNTAKIILKFNPDNELTEVHSYVSMSQMNRTFNLHASDIKNWAETDLSEEDLRFDAEFESARAIIGTISGETIAAIEIGYSSNGEVRLGSNRTMSQICLIFNSINELIKIRAFPTYSAMQSYNRKAKKESWSECDLEDMDVDVEISGVTGNVWYDIEKNQTIVELSTNDGW